MASKHQLNPTFVFFFEMKIFSHPNKITSVGSSAFQKNLQRLDQPTLVFFFAFLKKIYNDWIKSFSKSKWTGLLSVFRVLGIYNLWTSLDFLWTSYRQEFFSEPLSRHCLYLTGLRFALSTISR